jgi:DNA modification methylase
LRGGAVTVRILIGDCREKLRELPDASVHCCVTSPPYFGLRDYGCDGQMGLESTPDEFVGGMVEVFREVRRVLRDDGTLWLNIGDSYAGSGKGGNPEEGKQATNRGSQSVGVLYGTGKTAREAAVTNVTRKTFDGIKPKDLIGIPWLLAFALRADGWYLRQDIIWSKPNPMPESVRDRCTKAHEYLFLLSKGPRYYYDQEAILEPGADASLARLKQNISGQGGSNRAHGSIGKTMKAVGRPVAQHKQAALGQNLGGSLGSNDEPLFRNRRSVWEVATQPFSEAHFATYPPALIEPCILAGCPAKACAQCGAPWERIIEATAPDGRSAISAGGRTGRGEDGKPLMGNNMTHPGEKGSFNAARGVLTRKTIGDQPSCDCGARVAPGVVLDPFFGAGTTGLVADRLQRDCIGIELNPGYAEIARNRIQGEAGMFGEVLAA